MFDDIIEDGAKIVMIGIGVAIAAVIIFGVLSVLSY